MGDRMAPNRRGRHVQESLMVRVQMTPRQRARYVRWWTELSGLTAAELREIATGIWADRVFDEAHNLGRTSEAA